MLIFKQECFFMEDETMSWSSNIVKACKVPIAMEDSVEKVLRSEEAKKSSDNKVDLLKDIKCSSGNSSDTSELIEVEQKLNRTILGMEPSVSERVVLVKDEDIKRCSVAENLPIQSDVLEDRGTGFNFGKRWSYFNGEVFCFLLGVQLS